MFLLQSITFRQVLLGLTVGLAGLAGQSAWAGCRCGGGGGMPPGPLPFQAAPMWGHQGLRPLTASPPPGTLGRTYDLPSREIPAEKHPRIGMVDVLVRGATSVRVLNINPHREEDDIDGFQVDGNNSQWRFETKPLIPGVPHIYKVIFRFSEEPNSPETVRFIRLIPGRIVELVY